MDVNAIDLAGVDGDRAELERLAADNVKRVVANGDGQSPYHAAAYLELEDRLASDRRLRISG